MALYVWGSFYASVLELMWCCSLNLSRRLFLWALTTLLAMDNCGKVEMTKGWILCLCVFDGGLLGWGSQPTQSIDPICTAAFNKKKWEWQLILGSWCCNCFEIAMKVIKFLWWGATSWEAVGRRGRERAYGKFNQRVMLSGVFQYWYSYPIAIAPAAFPTVHSGAGSQWRWEEATSEGGGDSAQPATPHKGKPLSMLVTWTKQTANATVYFLFIFLLSVWRKNPEENTQEDTQ